MKHALPLAVLVALVTSGAAFADDDCNSPMSQWQPREAATSYVSGLGITADRLRIDDGCYEVRGRDSDGNRVELKLDPATLALVELEIRFQSGADPSRYLPGARGQAAMVPRAPVANPLLTPGTAPQVGGN
ncbi:MAG: PepSY domain-containing protein [Pseudotabrizicola sp.]|uniref:PepSY domain-containing protein n=1 Tax=Pseudotabrizicola sp. TaxID=2939647 RepID=UPI002725B9C4|nr:PepSY domain-containing protein [Pseudotabrizicola sp.]MDO8882699.1 PepSY domain-containing protein [Pseudotabrizicola sp.]MDP2079724.1 PepSY domain-containing protein [Pseudotabrizicola sp.]MDZ7575689.1 PepSY domain-containing protein [Pseudotabrizicola sp.]